MANFSISQVTKEQMLWMVNDLPDGSGKLFLKQLNQRHGPQAVVNFVSKIEALKNQSEIDPTKHLDMIRLRMYKLSHDEKRVMNDVTKMIPHRRDFFSQTARFTAFAIFGHALYQAPRDNSMWRSTPKSERDYYKAVSAGEAVIAGVIGVTPEYFQFQENMRSACYSATMIMGTLEQRQSEIAL